MIHNLPERDDRRPFRLPGACSEGEAIRELQGSVARDQSFAREPVPPTAMSGIEPLRKVTLEATPLR